MNRYGCSSGGVNYSCDIFLNGKKVNPNRHYGMFLQQNYNITKLLNGNGTNRLAVIVYPIPFVVPVAGRSDNQACTLAFSHSIHRPG